MKFVTGSARMRLWIGWVPLFGALLIISTGSGRAEDGPHNEKGHGHAHGKKKSAESIQHSGDEEEHSSEGDHGHEDTAKSKTEKHDDHAHEGEHDEHEEAAPRVGKGKAIEAASKATGIQLSSSALQTLGIKSKPVEVNAEQIELPAESGVFFKNEVGIYRVRAGWYKLLDAKLLERKAGKIFVQVSGLSEGDQVVVSGTALLRVAELEAWGGSGDGHGH